MVRLAGEGLRSVGADGELPIQERVLYPAPRSPFTGRGPVRGPGLYNALGRALVFLLLPGAALFVAAYTDNRELQFFASPQSYAAGRFLCTPRPR